MHLEDAVFPFFLCLEQFQCFVGVSRSDNAVRYFPFEEGCRFDITDIGQGNEIAVGAHAVGTTGTGIGRGQRGQGQVIDPVDFFQGIAHVRCYGCTGGADVFERSCCRKARRFLQFFDQLVAVERIEQVDIAGAAI